MNNRTKRLYKSYCCKDVNLNVKIIYYVYLAYESQIRDKKIYQCWIAGKYTGRFYGSTILNDFKKEYMGV